MEDKAGARMGVVADLGPLIGRKGYGRIGVAGGNDSEAAAGEKGAEAGDKGEVNVFFEEVVGKVCARVGTSVCRIEQDSGAGKRLLAVGDVAQQKNNGESQREVFERKRQSRLVDCKG